jgi:hypothetical protein
MRSVILIKRRADVSVGTDGSAATDSRCKNSLGTDGYRITSWLQQQMLERYFLEKRRHGVQNKGAQLITLQTAGDTLEGLRKSSKILSVRNKRGPPLGHKVISTWF